MAADDKNERSAACARADQVGKVFVVVVVAHRVRKCLVCEELFTRRSAAEHATVPCMPGIRMQLGGNDADRRPASNHHRGTSGASGGRADSRATTRANARAGA
jgi:hypothetical protein